MQSSNLKTTGGATTTQANTHKRNNSDGNKTTYDDASNPNTSNHRKTPKIPKPKVNVNHFVKIRAARVRDMWWDDYDLGVLDPIRLNPLGSNKFDYDIDKILLSAFMKVPHAKGHAVTVIRQGKRYTSTVKYPKTKDEIGCIMHARFSMVPFLYESLLPLVCQLMDSYIATGDARKALADFSCKIYCVTEDENDDLKLYKYAHRNIVNCFEAEALKTILRHFKVGFKFDDETEKHIQKWVRFFEGGEFPRGGMRDFVTLRVNLLNALVYRWDLPVVTPLKCDAKAATKLARISVANRIYVEENMKFTNDINTQQLHTKFGPMAVLFSPNHLNKKSTTPRAKLMAKYISELTGSSTGDLSQFTLFGVTTKSLLQDSDEHIAKASHIAGSNFSRGAMEVLEDPDTRESIASTANAFGSSMGTAVSKHLDTWFKGFVERARSHLGQAADAVIGPFKKIFDIITEWIGPFFRKIAEMFDSVSQVFARSLKAMHIDPALFKEKASPVNLVIVAATYIVIKKTDSYLLKGFALFFMLHKFGLASSPHELISQFMEQGSDSPAEMTSAFTDFFSNATSAIGSFLRMILSKFTPFAWFNKFIDSCSSALAPSFKMLSNVAGSVKNLGEVIRFFKSAIQLVVSKLRGYLGADTTVADILAEGLNSSAIRNFSANVEVLKSPAGRKALISSKTLQDQVLEAYPFAMALHDECMKRLGDRYHASSINIILGYVRDYLVLLGDVQTIAMYAKYRQEPVGVCLAGPPGTGKSRIMNEIIRKVYFKLFAKEVGSDVYARSKTKHWDGYLGQTVLMKDDSNTTNDPEILTEIINLYNTIPVIVPMASVNEKGRFFQSTLIFETTNAPFPHHESIVSPAAIWRRRDFLIVFRKRTVDGQEVVTMQSAADVRDPNNRTFTDVTVDELVDLIVDRYNVKKSWLKDLSTNAIESEAKWRRVYAKVGGDTKKMGPPTWTRFQNLVTNLDRDNVGIFGNLSESERVHAIRLAQQASPSTGMPNGLTGDWIGPDTIEPDEEDPGEGTSEQTTRTPNTGWHIKIGDNAVRVEPQPTRPSRTVPTEDNVIRIGTLDYEYDPRTSRVRNPETGDWHRIYYSHFDSEQSYARYPNLGVAHVMQNFLERIERIEDKTTLKSHFVEIDGTCRSEGDVWYAFLLGELRGSGLSAREVPTDPKERRLKFGFYVPPRSGTTYEGIDRAYYNIILRLCNPDERGYYSDFTRFLPSMLIESAPIVPGHHDAPLDLLELEGGFEDPTSTDPDPPSAQSDCTICLSEVGNDEATITNCGHKFHQRCLREWQTSGRANTCLCPYCRSPIAPIETYLKIRPIKRCIVEKGVILVDQSEPFSPLTLYDDVITPALIRDSYSNFAWEPSRPMSSDDLNRSLPPDQALADLQARRNMMAEATSHPLKLARKFLNHLAYDKHDNSLYLIAPPNTLDALWNDPNLIREVKQWLRLTGGRSEVQDLEYALAYATQKIEASIAYIHLANHITSIRQGIHRKLKFILGVYRSAVSWMRTNAVALIVIVLYGSATASIVARTFQHLKFAEDEMTLAAEERPYLLIENARLKRQLAELTSNEFTSRQFFKKKKSPREPTGHIESTFTSGGEVDRYAGVHNNLRLMQKADGSWFNALLLGGKYALCNVHSIQEEMAQGGWFTLKCIARFDNQRAIRVHTDNIRVIPNADACVFWCPDINSVRKITHRFVSRAEKKPSELSYSGLYLSNGRANPIRGTMENVVVKMAHDPSLGKKCATDFLKDRRVLTATGILGRGLSGGIYYDSRLDTGIFGIQSTLQTSIDGPVNTAAIVYREDLDRIITNLNESSKLAKNWNFDWANEEHTRLELDVDVENIPVADLFDSDVPLIGKVPDENIVGVNCKSKIHKTPIAQFFSTARTPAELNALAEGVAEGTHPAQKSINKTGLGNQIPLPDDYLAQSVDDISNYLTWKMQLANSLTQHSYSLEDAIRDEDGKYPPLKLTSSAGIPYVLNKKLGGKKDHISIDEETRTIQISEELEENVRNTISSLARFVLPRDVSYECLKDELRPIAKKYDARTITVLPVHANLVYRMFFMPFDYAMCKLGNGLNPVCVGINPVAHWSNLYFSLHEVGSRGMEVDVSKWDGKMTPQLLRHYVEIVNRVYENCVPPSGVTETMDGLGEVELTQRVRRGVVEGMTYSVVQFANIVFQKTQGMSSGWGGTAMCNSIVHWMMIYTFFLEISDDIDCASWKSMDVFVEHFCVRVYGDDMIMSISDRALEMGFTPTSFADKYRKYGWTVTSAAKDRGAGETIKVDDMQFLKRVFRVDELIPSWIHPCLDKNTIEDLAYWQKNDLEPEESLRENLMTALEFASEWGRPYFDDFLARINKSLQKTGRVPIMTNYIAIRSVMYGRHIEP